MRLLSPSLLKTRPFGAAADDALHAVEGAAADEEDLRGVDLNHGLAGILAAALGGHACHGALDELEQRLLHAFAGHVARDRRVLALASDLVDFVKVDDASLGALDVAVGGLHELGDDVLDVLAHVARLGERRRVGNGERHVERTGKRLRQQRLAGARRTDQKNV